MSYAFNSCVKINEKHKIESATEKPGFHKDDTLNTQMEMIWSGMSKVVSLKLSLGAR